jgi:hypothetical protein
MDHVLHAFLVNTALQAAELQDRSDVAKIEGLPPFPPSGYRCRFDVPYLRRTAEGTVEIDPGPVVCLIRFPDDYVRSADPKLFLHVASVANLEFVHPNVAHTSVCLGSSFEPGTPIGALVWQLFEIVTYRNCTVDERNAMNPEACRLLRLHSTLVESLERPRLFRPRASVMRSRQAGNDVMSGALPPITDAPSSTVEPGGTTLGPETGVARRTRAALRDASVALEYRDFHGEGDPTCTP